jgi:hypothetical protein
VIQGLLRKGSVRKGSVMKDLVRNRGKEDAW